MSEIMLNMLENLREENRQLREKVKDLEAENLHFEAINWELHFNNAELAERLRSVGPATLKQIMVDSQTLNKEPTLQKILAIYKESKCPAKTNHDAP